MKKWMVTFGWLYRDNDHPSGMPVHPDSVAAIYAEDYTAALELVHANFGPYFVFLTEWDATTRSWYPGPTVAVIKEEDIEQQVLSAFALVDNSEPDSEPYDVIQPLVPVTTWRALSQCFGHDVEQFHRSWSVSTAMREKWDGTARALADLGPVEWMDIRNIGIVSAAHIYWALSGLGYHVHLGLVEGTESWERALATVKAREGVA